VLGGRCGGAVMLTIGSLFSGIGLLDYGLVQAGLGPVVFQCEIDPWRRRVLARHFPSAERFADASQRRNWPAVDLLCGGFPCQDLSSASHGLGRGLAGHKSGLWYWFAKAVEAIRPAFVVVENVESGARRWLPAVRRHLHLYGYRSLALGIAARDLGASHGRPRVFVVGYSDEGCQSARAKHGEVARLPPPANPLRDGRLPSPARLRMDDGAADGLERLRALGDGVYWPAAWVVGRVVVERLIAS